jgi:hypothetical protein
MFDPQSRTFRYDASLGQLVSPYFDPETQTISTYYKLGCGGHCYESSQYKWGKNHLLMISQTVQDVVTLSDEKVYIVEIHKERIDGELKMTSGKVLSVDDL